MGTVYWIVIRRDGGVPAVWVSQLLDQKELRAALGVYPLASMETEVSQGADRIVYDISAWLTSSLAQVAAKTAPSTQQLKTFPKRNQSQRQAGMNVAAQGIAAEFGCSSGSAQSRGRRAAPPC